jgi:peptidyl-tRNA hydrolase
MDAAAYVLQKFTSQEQEILDMTLDRAVKAAQVFVERGLETAMNLFNGALKEG